MVFGIRGVGSPLRKDDDKMKFLVDIVGYGKCKAARFE